MAVLQYSTTILKIGAKRAQRSLFAQPNSYSCMYTYLNLGILTKEDNHLMQVNICLKRPKLLLSALKEIKQNTVSRRPWNI